jgi:hypothetical protein
MGPPPLRGARAARRAAAALALGPHTLPPSHVYRAGGGKRAGLRQGIPVTGSKAWAPDPQQADPASS